MAMRDNAAVALAAQALIFDLELCSTLPMGAASHSGSDPKEMLHNRNPTRMMHARHEVRQFTLGLSNRS